MEQQPQEQQQQQQPGRAGMSFFRRRRSSVGGGVLLDARKLGATPPPTPAGTPEPGASAPQENTKRARRKPSLALFIPGAFSNPSSTAVLTPTVPSTAVTPRAPSPSTNPFRVSMMLLTGPKTAPIEHHVPAFPNTYDKNGFLIPPESASTMNVQGEYEASNRGISKRKSFRLPSFARGTNHPKATASDLPEDQVWSAGVAWSEGHKQQRLTRSPSSSAAPSRALPTPTARAAATDDGSSMTAPISPNSRRRASIAVFQLTHPTVSPSAFPRPPAILSCSKSISSSSACSSSGSTTTATASTRRSSRRSVVAAGAGHALSRSSSQASASSVSTASTKHLPDFDALLAGGETIRVSLTPHKYERVMLEDGGEAEEEDGVIKEEDEEVVVVGEEEVEVGEGKGTLERGESWRRW